MLSNNTMYTALPTNDLEASMEFYGKTLGLPVVDENESGVWYQTGTSRIVVYRSEYAGTNQGTAAIWEVPDPKATLRALRARGVKFERYDFPGVKRLGYLHKFPTFDAAWFRDPVGNLICITHHL